ncbi:MAG: alginate lyase family protein [Gammaproteobacteria bacterium]|nr:alginate lyase family protein [Gammaproteobacteria bacterium]
MKTNKSMLSSKKGKLAFLLINIFLAGSITTAIAHEQAHPSTLINPDELAAIKAKIAKNLEPWKSAYDQLLIQADSVLQDDRDFSVIFGGVNRCSVPVRAFCTMPSPTGTPNQYDAVEAARPVGIAIRDLGMAYAFSGDAKYAERLVELVRIWATDPITGMIPRIYANQDRIELFPTMSGVIYGVDLAWNYPGWDLAEKTAFKAWVQAFGESAISLSPSNNNFENWRNAFLSVAGAFTNDQVLMDAAFQNFRNAIPGQIVNEYSVNAGLMTQEYERSSSTHDRSTSHSKWGGLGYSMFAIHAMTMTAEIARQQGVDLYNYTVPSTGAGLKLALDTHAPYLIDPDLWPWGQGRDIVATDGIGAYELAYSVWEDSAYLEVVERWGRPMGMNIWALGAVTLTHANRFELSFTPVPPSIVTQPSTVTVTEGEDATFGVVASGSATLAYQWFRNGASIADATNASYTIMATTPADNATYNVDVTNDLGSISSSGAVLTVLADTQAPTLVSAVAVSETRVGIRFSEAVSPGSAETISNYQLSLGITVTNASLSDDGRTISLTLSELTPDTNYTVSVSSVQDLAQTPNTIAAQSSINFTYRSADGFEDGNADGWTPLTESRWEVVLDEGNYVYWLNTTEFPQGLERQLGEYSLLSGAYGDFTFTARARLGDDVDSNALADYAVVFGFQNANNYYFAMFNNQQSATQLFKVIDGNRTALPKEASSDWLTDNLYHRIVISRSGSEIKVYFDGTLILSATDSSLGAGRVGVGSYNDSAYFDDVSVTGAVDLPDTPDPDTTAPVITLLGADPQIITMGGNYAELGATAMDNMDVDISSIVIDATAVDTATIGNYSVTYNVMDAAGNAATQVVRTVNVTAAASDNSAADNSGSSSVASDNSGGGGVFGLLSGSLLFMLLVFRFRRSGGVNR